MADLSFLPDKPDLSFLPDQPKVIPSDVVPIGDPQVRGAFDDFRTLGGGDALRPPKTIVKAPALTTPSDFIRKGEAPTPTTAAGLQDFLFKPTKPSPEALGPGLAGLGDPIESLKVASEFTRPLAEKLAKPITEPLPVMDMMGNMTEISAEKRTSEKERILAGLQGLLPLFPRDIADPIVKRHPIARAVGSLTGLVGTGIGVAKTFPAVANAKALSGLGTFAREVGARMAQGGLTFGLRKGITNTAELASGKDRTAAEFMGDVMKEGIFGTVLGGISAAPAPLIRIPAEMTYGFAWTKFIEHGSNFEAGITAAMFGIFGMFNRANLKGAYRASSIDAAERAALDSLKRGGQSTPAAIDKVRRAFAEIKRNPKQFDKFGIKEWDAWTKKFQKADITPFKAAPQQIPGANPPGFTTDVGPGNIAVQGPLGGPPAQGPFPSLGPSPSTSGSRVDPFADPNADTDAPFNLLDIPIPPGQTQGPFISSIQTKETTPELADADKGIGKKKLTTAQKKQRARNLLERIKKLGDTPLNSPILIKDLERIASGELVDDLEAENAMDAILSTLKLAEEGKGVTKKISEEKPVTSINNKQAELFGKIVLKEGEGKNPLQDIKDAETAGDITNSQANNLVQAVFDLRTLGKKPTLKDLFEAFNKPFKPKADEPFDFTGIGKGKKRIPKVTKADTQREKDIKKRDDDLIGLGEDIKSVAGNTNDPDHAANLQDLRNLTDQELDRFITKMGERGNKVAKKAGMDELDRRFKDVKPSPVEKEGAPTIEDILLGPTGIEPPTKPPTIKEPVEPEPEGTPPNTEERGMLKGFLRQARREPNLLSPAKVKAQPGIVKDLLRKLEAAIAKNPKIKGLMSADDKKVYNDALARFGKAGKPDVRKAEKPKVEEKKPTPLEEGIDKVSPLGLPDNFNFVSADKQNQFKAELRKKEAVLVQRAKNLLQRFNALDPETTNKDAHIGIPSRLEQIIKEGPDSSSEQLMKRFASFIANEEGVTTPIAEAPAGEPTPLEKGIAKEPAKGDVDFIETLKGEQKGVNQKNTGPFRKPSVYRAFRKADKGGKGDPVGPPFATREAAQKYLDAPTTPLNNADFVIEQERRPAFERIEPEEKQKKLSKGEEQAKKRAFQIKSPKLLAKKTIAGKKPSKAVIKEIENLVGQVQEVNKLTHFDKGKIRETQERKDAQKLETRFREFVILEIADHWDLDLDTKVDQTRVIKILNAMLREIGILGKPGEAGFITTEFLFPKTIKRIQRTLKKRAIQKKRAAQEKAFGAAVKADAQSIVNQARAAGLSVVDFIRANPDQFPGVPKTDAGLNRAVADALIDIPIKVENLKKNSVVQFRPAPTVGVTGVKKLAGDLGIVQKVGDTIEVAFKDGISEFTREEAPKFLRESGQILDLRKLPTKKVPDVVANILAKNPKHAQLASAANAAINAAIANPDDPLVQAKATQITKRLIGALTDKVIDINDIAGVARNHDMTSDQMVTLLVTELRTMSPEAGQVLNLLSQLSKKIKKLGVTQETINTLFPEGESQLEPKDVFLHKVGDKVNSGANILKGFLTSQLKTAMRNSFVQGAVTLTEYTNQLAIGAYQGITGTGIKGKEGSGAAAYEQALKGAMQDVLSFSQNLGKLIRKEEGGKFGRDKERALLRLLEEFSLQKQELFKAPIHDVVVNQNFIRILNAANILQENFYRTLLVEAELARIAKQHGTTIRDVAFFRRHADLVDQAVERALKNTFASNLKQTMFVGKIIDLYKKLPALGFLTGNPFVRFMFNNYNMILRRSPIGLLNFFSREEQRLLQGPNNIEQVRHLANALTGVLFLATAMALRTERFAGPKYYQIDITPHNKEDDKFWDTRPFAPLPQYLFAVELAKNMMGNKEQTTLTATDFFQAVVSISRIAGTGFVGIDFLRSEPFKEKVSGEQSKENASRLIASFFGQIASAPSVPLAQLQDIVGAFDPEENKFKSVRDRPFLGPTINNIPWLKRTLPDLQQVGRAEPQQPGRLEGLIEFGTGLRVQRVNRFEQELARHGISSLGPRTGNPVVNQRIVDEMNSPLAQEAFTALITDSSYKNEKDPKVRKEMLSKWLSDAFSVAKENLIAFDDKVSGFLLEKKMDRAMTQVNKDIGEALMDVTIEVLGTTKEELFSESLQELISGPSQ